MTSRIFSILCLGLFAVLNSNTAIAEDKYCFFIDKGGKEYYCCEGKIHNTGPFGDGPVLRECLLIIRAPGDKVANVEQDKQDGLVIKQYAFGVKQVVDWSEATRVELDEICKEWFEHFNDEWFPLPPADVRAYCETEYNESNIEDNISYDEAVEILNSALEESDLDANPTDSSLDSFEAPLSIERDLSEGNMMDPNFHGTMNFQSDAIESSKYDYPPSIDTLLIQGVAEIGDMLPDSILGYDIKPSLFGDIIDRPLPEPDYEFYSK